ncbi:MULTISPECIES: transcriptional regulator GcvA [Rhodomicrobium]|uniref:transcriptional regulator GcvA n=1 Tax=Rhodomicrobium TaxID=1068 RepID=UPI000B4B6B80|nr:MULTISPECIES: transcriptional regulator GcvA [Rhodomicrobium]
MTQAIPPLNALRAFEAAARLGSLKAAATEASVTHGAISRHIRLLEDWLGAPLFLRHNRRVVLTELGQSYLAEIAPAFQRIARATDDARKRRRRKSLHVNALATFTVRWLLPRLADFRHAHPEIDVALTTSNDAVDLAGEAADIVIRGGPDTIHGYQTRVFLTETRQPVCHPALLENLPLAAPSDLRAHTLLHSSNMARLWDEWLTHAGVPGLEAAGNLVLDHFYLAVEAAAGGLGVAMGPSALIGADLAAGRLVTPFPDLVLPARSYCAYVRDPMRNDARIRAFCDWLAKDRPAPIPSETPAAGDR